MSHLPEEDQLLSPPWPRAAAPRAARPDLVDLRDQLLAAYFSAGKIIPEVRWAQRRTARSMGWFEPGEAHGRILINPLLAEEPVPAIYLQYVMYHELLHAYLPPVRRAGKLVYHHRLFRVRERQFIGYVEAMRWEERHLPRLCDGDASAHVEEAQR